jgi:hypothetical protein
VRATLLCPLHCKGRWRSCRNWTLPSLWHMQTTSSCKALGELSRLHSHPVDSALLEPLGLQVMPSECSAYSTVGADSPAVSVTLGMQHTLRGITAAVSPVGEAAFVAAHARECTSKACHLVVALDGLPSLPRTAGSSCRGFCSCAWYTSPGLTNERL